MPIDGGFDVSIIPIADESYLGYLYSTAFALPSFFGHDREKFEADLRLTLEEISPSGNLIEELTAGALIATRPN